MIGKKSIARVAAMVGHPFVESSLRSFDTMALAYRAVRVLPKALSTDFGAFIVHFDSLIVRCSKLVALASFAAGAVMAMQFGAGMERFGAKTYVPTIVATSIVQALAPMLAALMAAARSGGGLAADIAGMVITQQIDAVKALGSDPYRKIYTPSIAALVLGLPLLTIVADVAGLLGGLVIEVTTLSLPLSQSFVKTIAAIHPQNALLAAAKTSVAGLVIGVLATREGLQARGGTLGIGRATTAAIIASTIGVLLADLVLTKIIWLLQ